MISVLWFENSDLVTWCHWAADSQSVVLTALSNLNVWRWDLKTGGTSLWGGVNHNSESFCEISPNGELIACAEDERETYIYLLATQQLKVRHSSPADIRNFSFSSCSRYLLISLVTGLLILVDTNSGVERQRFPGVDSGDDTSYLIGDDFWGANDEYILAMASS